MDHRGDRQKFVDAIKKAGKFEDFMARIGELLVEEPLLSDEDRFRKAARQFAIELGWYKDGTIQPKPPVPEKVAFPHPVGVPPESVKPSLPRGENEPAEPDPDKPPDAFKRDFEGKPETSYKQDIEWVYAHISILDLVPADAPSASAWWLLLQARADPKILREGLMLFARKEKPEDDEQERAIQKQGRATEAELMELLERIGVEVHVGI